jgi:arsenite-transporting ATPase
LILSTDPAHSLGDVLDVSLGARPRRVAPGLDAAELDAPRAFARWLEEHRGALSEVIEHGTWLDRPDIDALLDLTLPGVDELVGLLEIVRLASPKYETVIIDTAPTGHTLRLLASPGAVEAVAAVLDGLQEEHRIIRNQFARMARPEAADRLIATIAQQASAAAAVLRDARGTAFTWVLLPEALSIAESEDGISALTRTGIAVERIVVNRVLPRGAPCPLCDRRRAEEHRALAAIARGIGRGRRVCIADAQLREPRGLRALARFSIRALTTRRQAARLRPVRIAARGSGRSGFDPAVLGALRGAELVFVGGKGGVGKTTVAAAIAVRVAAAMPSDSVMLLSTDPAHSLADVFQAPVGDRAAVVRGGPRNLVVRELDAPRALRERRESLQAMLEEMSASAGGAAASALPLIDLAPPGIDELFGMLSVVEARAAHRVVIVDTAPTGHTLRLLEMPEAAREWVRLLLRVLLKYKALVKPGRIAEELVHASQSLRTLQSVLRDPARARFIVVTRAAAVARAETERLLRRLRSLELATPAIVVNARTLAPGSCVRCTAAFTAERREVEALSRFARRGRRRDCVIIQTPLVAPPPRGAAALGRWADTWNAPEP